MTCNHPEPELCEKLGQHLFGKMYEKYKNNETFRKAMDDNVIGKSATRPPLLTQATTALGSFVRHVATDGFVTLQENLLKERLNICNQCINYDAQHGRCHVCGCFIKVKASWATEDCPMGKWPSLPGKRPRSGCGGCPGA